MIDFHSHVLPEVDDGSSNLDESLAMLEMEAAQGMTHVVATPHFYAQQDQLETFLVRRMEAEKKLRAAMDNNPGIPQLSIGAEVHYFRGMGNSEAISELTITGGKSILVEMPQPPWTEEMYRELVKMRENFGVIPVIAHVDRYISPLRSHGIPKKLEELPVLVQANASFFLNRRTRAMALKMLKKGQIHLLGSDCHDLRERPPQLGQAVEIIRKTLGQEWINCIRERAEAILEM